MTTKTYSPGELAVKIELHNKWRRGEINFMPACDNPVSARELGIVMEQAAAMLRKMEWQSIDTAPKDGTFIIIADKFYKRPWFARWVDYGSYKGFESDGNHRKNLQPTHWLPLDVFTLPKE